MAQLLNSMKDFFVSKGQPKTQEFIRLQFLGRLRSRHSAAPDVGINDGDNLELGTGLERSKHSLAFLYSLLRFVKLVGSAWDDRFPSWRSGIAGFTILASIVLILNISALAWTATHLDDGHYATLAIGSYESISNLSGWLHFATNILSTALLAGSNYCMQCLSSPTRAEVDAVHARGSYLNIGTLSWRNVLASRKRRIFLLVLLAISSIAMHPIYETSTGITIALQSHTSALVTRGFRVLSFEDFDRIAWQKSHNAKPTNRSSSTIEWAATENLRYIQNITTNDQIRDTSLWKNISALECAKYGVLQTETSTLLIMLNETPEQGFAYQDPLLVPYSSFSYSHMLAVYLRKELYFTHGTPEEDWVNTSKWFTHWLTRVSYCLSRKVPGRSRLQVHLWFPLTATALNVIKLGCLLSTFKEQQRTPLVTTGDAIASFLTSPCVHSAGMCLLSQEELVRKLKERQDDNKVDATLTYKTFKARQLRYCRSVSFSRWVVNVSSFMLMMLLSVYGYVRIQNHFQSNPIDRGLHSLWKMGFGKLNVHSLTEKTLCAFRYPASRDYRKWGDRLECERKYHGVSAMILTNLPQLSVSAIYLSLNHQLTLMVQLRDWARLASRRQAIRVSNPEPDSDQVSTYWLSLPYRYSIPLLLTSVSWGWLVSNTFFVMRYAVYHDISIDDVPDAPNYTMGFSAIALIYSFVFGLVIFGVSAAFGFRKCTSGMPLGPSNSLVIAAACHPPERDRYAARNMVKWGAVPTGNSTGEVDSPHHCTITSRRVEDPVEGRWYG